MTRKLVAALMGVAAILPGAAVAQDGERGRRDRGAEQRAERGPERQRMTERRTIDGDRRGDERWDVARYRDRNGDGRLDHRGGRPEYRAPAIVRGQGYNRDWRRDGRYDWNRYRSVNRGAYRLPRYYAPSSWRYGYRRFGVGVRLGAPLFASRYWIGDPWAYRLPPAYGPYRWVRYYDDAILVDLRTGYTVDVIHGIFW